MNSETAKPEWKVAIDLLRETNPFLLKRLSRKMMNYLFRSGTSKIEQLIKLIDEPEDQLSTKIEYNENRPLPRINQELLIKIVEEVFNIAEQELSTEKINQIIKSCIKREHTRFLSIAAGKREIALNEIKDALCKFIMLPKEQQSLSIEDSMSIRVGLIRRFFSDNLDYINTLKNYVTIHSFTETLNRIIGSPWGNGKLGGKASGLFRAKQILNSAKAEHKILNYIKTPKTWYITSDGIYDFLYFNTLEDFVGVKYSDPGDIKKEYSYIEQVFKNSTMPPDILSGIKLILDDFGETPLIVRSSSLLEDSTIASFAGKYKSLFVANQGSKEERLSELVDAIEEVYASVFGPDPIEYRRENGLLDFSEEMAIMIQEVVGQKIGKYYFPAFAGVAFSYNEFRWSPRIKREDGIIRLVAGLGTRAVDRLGNDFPTLICPGQPNLKTNVILEEIYRYSQKYIDVVNLETKKFETIKFETLIDEIEIDYPQLNNIISFIKDGQLTQPIGSFIDLEKGDIVINFNGLIKKGVFVKQIKLTLDLLQEAYGYPVDIEFASDGTPDNLYILQCRPQSYIKDLSNVTIPNNIEDNKIVFSANKFITTAKVDNIDYIVYVDPEKYDSIETLNKLLQIGKIVGLLNRKLPRKSFILMGPGRWGSKGDIKLGVKVGYCDINNTSMLIEIAKKKKDYVPDLSFGTHFFQDLVEAKIRYLPLYPDEEKNIFNEEFFSKSKNILPDLIPDNEDLKDVVKVIKISDLYPKSSLIITMNGEIPKAIGFIAKNK